MNTNRPELKPEEKKELFLVCLAMAKGNITEACRLVGVHRKTYYYWIEDDPEFAAEIQDTKGEDLDRAIESLKLVTFGGEKILSDGKIVFIPPSLSALKYYLDHQGKDEGFGKIGKGMSQLPSGDLHLHLHQPPEPKDLADWEQQVGEARRKRLEESEKGEEDGSNGEQ